VTLLLATRSAHKVAEVRRILADVPGLRLLTPDDLGLAVTPEEEELEPHDTFEENARSKARYFQALSGIATVADDSGIEVDALGGAPGVRSKRFAPVPEGLGGAARDRANNAHLLRLLEGRPPEQRTARYVCVVALDEGAGGCETLRGEAEGLIAEAPRGSGGFGYDPLFLDPALGRTFAEISGEEKDARSHRGAAFRGLAERLRRRSAFV
jgi:XTP/dITP diphosphohydrolase